MVAIDRFRGKYNFLSNFFPCSIVLTMYNTQDFTYTYPSVEHAFQAQKPIDPRRHDEIRNAPNPAAAKRMGKNCVIRSDWEKIRVWVMYQCLLAKFSDPELRRQLLATGDTELIEGNHWGDRFWGVCAGEGKNMLGQLLMHVRWEIRMGGL